MSKKSRLFLILSIVIFIFVFCVALMVGRYPIKISDFFNCLFTSDGSYETHKSIILNLRLPRTIMAACVGVGLSLSGLLFPWAQFSKQKSEKALDKRLKMR